MNGLSCHKVDAMPLPPISTEWPMHYENSSARFVMCTSTTSSYGHRPWRNTNGTVLLCLKCSEKPTFTAIKQNPTPSPLNYVSLAIPSWGLVSSLTPTKLTILHLGPNQWLPPMSGDSWDRVSLRKSGISLKMIQRLTNFLQWYLWNAKNILACVILSMYIENLTLQIYQVLKYQAGMVLIHHRFLSLQWLLDGGINLEINFLVNSSHWL